MNLSDTLTSMSSRANYLSSAITIKRYVLIILALIVLILSTFLIAVASVKLHEAKTESMTSLFTPTITTVFVQTTSETLDPFGAGPWENQMLPDTIIPRTYNLEIRVYPELNMYEGI